MKRETEDLFETLARITRPVSIKYVVKRCVKCDFGIYEETDSDMCQECQNEADFELNRSSAEINDER